MSSDQTSDYRPGAKLAGAILASPSGERMKAIKQAGALMDPGGGSLETSAAVQALHLICLSQQAELDWLRENMIYLSNRVTALNSTGWE